MILKPTNRSKRTLAVTFHIFNSQQRAFTKPIKSVAVLHASGKFTEICADNQHHFDVMQSYWSCKAIIFFRNQILKIGLEVHYSPAPRKGFFSTVLLAMHILKVIWKKMLQTLCKHSTFLLHAPLSHTILPNPLAQQRFNYFLCNYPDGIDQQVMVE